MKTKTESLKSVEMANTEKVILKKDVRESEGYYRRRFYAGVSGDTIRVCEEALTLPQALTWKQEKEELYVADESIRLSPKKVEQDKPKARARRKPKTDVEKDVTEQETE